MTPELRAEIMNVLQRLLPWLMPVAIIFVFCLASNWRLWMIRRAYRKNYRVNQKWVDALKEMRSRHVAIATEPIYEKISARFWEGVSNEARACPGCGGWIARGVSGCDKCKAGPRKPTYRCLACGQLHPTDEVRACSGPAMEVKVNGDVHASVPWPTKPIGKIVPYKNHVHVEFHKEYEVRHGFDDDDRIEPDDADRQLGWKR